MLSVDSGSLLAGELARVVSKASGVVPVTLPYPVHWDGPRSVVATSQTSTAELYVLMSPLCYGSDVHCTCLRRLPLLAEGTPQYHRALSLLEEDARLVVSFIGLKPGDTCSEYWGLWALLSPTLDSKSQEWELL